MPTRRDTRPSEKYLVLPTKVVLDGGKSLLVYETLNGRAIMEAGFARKLS